MAPDLKTALDERYSKLAGETCCLSCGGAIGYANPKEGEICLDLGSGRGTDVIRMAEKAGPCGFAYGIDVSKGMLDKARVTAEKLGVTNVKFIEAELESLPLENDSIDLAISNCTINHAKNKNSVWRELFRVLKPGGRFVVSDIYSSEKVPEKWAANPEAVAECWAGAVTKEEYIRILGEGGFHKPIILEESSPYPKGEITVSSFTLTAIKGSCCCKKQKGGEG